MGELVARHPGCMSVRSYFSLLKDQQELTLCLMQLLSNPNEVYINVAVGPEECAETAKNAIPAIKYQERQQKEPTGTTVSRLDD
jgi:hypothetical protein